MHKLLKHRCGIFWHMETHNYGAAGSGSCKWRKFLNCPRDSDTAITTDHKPQEYEAEGRWRLDESDEVDLK